MPCRGGALGVTRQMTQQRNEESRELVDCLAQVFELNTSIVTSSTAVSIWLSAPTTSPLDATFGVFLGSRSRAGSDFGGQLMVGFQNSGLDDLLKWRRSLKKCYQA